MGDGEVIVPVPVSQAQIERAVQAAVSVKSQELIQEFSRSLALKGDELRDQHQALLDRVQAAGDRVETKIKDVDSSVEAARDRVDAKIKDVDSSLEAIQNKVNARVTTYVVPAVVLTVISVVLAIFTAVGGFDVIEKVQHLKKGVEDADTTYADIAPKLADLKLKVASALATADTDRINQLQDQLKKLQDELDAYDKKNNRNNAQGGGRGSQAGQTK